MIRQDLRAWKEKKECARRMREIVRGPQESALHTLDSPGGKALPKPNNLFPASSAPPEGSIDSPESLQELVTSSSAARAKAPGEPTKLAGKASHSHQTSCFEILLAQLVLPSIRAVKSAVMAHHVQDNITALEELRFCF